MSTQELLIVPDPEHSHLIEVWEPLPTKAPNPNLAQPYCCYVNIVVFYLRPYVLRPWHRYWICNGKRKAEKPGRSYEEWDRIETTLRIDAVVEYEGRKFRCYTGGRVIWKHKRWWMKREAKLERD